MPLFEFRCGKCRTQFEALCRSGDAGGVSCPECGAPAPDRLISSFAVSRQLTPCGTPSSEARGSCAMNARAGGCGCCGAD